MWVAFAVLLGFYAYFAFVAYMIVLFFRHRDAWAVAMFTSWAKEQGLRALGIESRRIVLGPFFYRFHAGQVVLRFAALDKDGRRRTGWALCGSRSLGLLDERLALRWDAEPAGELPIERRHRKRRKAAVWDPEFDV